MTATAVDAQAIIADLAGRSREEIARILVALPAAEQEAVLALLQAVPDVVIQGNARKLWHSKRREYMAAGPAETAKTFSVCQYLHEQCMNFPRLRVVLTRDTYEALRTSAVRTYREKVIRQDSAGRSPYGVSAFGGERPEYFAYPNGSRIYTKGLDNPESVLSEEWDIAAVCQAELIPGDTWQKLVTRTTGRAGNLPRSYRGPRLIGECNPGPPTHWILSRRDAGHLEFVEHSHTDNPALWDEEALGWTEQGLATMAALDSLDGIDRLRLRDGQWVSAEGTVFTIVEANLGRELYIDKWPTEITIDPSNGSGAYAALVIQQHNDRILVVDEYYQVGGVDEDFAAWLKASRYHARLTDAISDPAKPDTIKRLSVLLKHPVRAKEGKKDIVAGINAVKSVLLPDPVLKRSKLIIDRDTCPMLLDEFSKYVWRQAPRNAPEMNVSATPVDAWNHCIDALSYYITTKHLTSHRASLLAEPATEVQSPFSFRRG
jgi:phage terminase large subunit